MSDTIITHQPALAVTPPGLKPCRVSRELFREIKSWIAEAPDSITLKDFPTLASELQLADRDRDMSTLEERFPNFCKFISEQKTYDQFLRGLTDGFAIKRYRVAFYYAPTEHAPAGLQIVIRESENANHLQQYVTELLSAYASKGYVIKKDDFSVGDYGIYQIGGVHRHCVLRLSLIKDRPTLLTAQKDPQAGYSGVLEEGEAIS